MLWLADILVQLAKRRPCFHAEADFQHALAWQIQQLFPDANIRLEVPIMGHTKLLHVDIWIIFPAHIWALELKYKTRALEAVAAHESYHLLNQGAQDIGRYDFVKDVYRLEQLAATYPTLRGYAILLSNDSNYWTPSLRQATIDTDFRLGDGRILSGTMAWQAQAGKGTTRGRESPLTLYGHYPIMWQTYSILDGTGPTHFRYTLVEVTAPSKG